MRKVVKFSGVTVGAGLVLGLGVVGWLYIHRSNVATAVVPGSGVAASGLNAGASGQAIPLTTSLSASPASTPGLAVTGDGNQGSVMGSQTGGSSSGGSGGGSESSASGGSDSGSSDSSSNSLPGPSGFGTYDQYRGNATALYIDTQPGTGAAVASGSTATVQYRGWLTNGKEFDETYASGKAFAFKEGAGNVIPGFEEAIFGMKAGGERRLIIPPSQGYGDTAHGPIPADSVLVFDVVLVSVQ